MNKFTKKLFRSSLIILYGIVLSSLSFPQENRNVWTSPLHKCWEYLSSEMIRIGGASDNVQNLYIPMNGGQILAIDENGNKLWNLEIGGQIISDFSLKQNLLQVNNELQKEKINEFFKRKIEVKAGTILDTKSSKSLIYISSTTNQNFEIHYWKKGLVQKVDKNKNIIWSTDLNTKIITEPIYYRNLVGFGTTNKTLVFLDNKSGEIFTQFTLKSEITSKIVSNDNILFFGDSLGYIYRLDLQTGKFVWIVKTGGKIVEVSEVRNFSRKFLLLSSNDNFAYLISKKKGKKMWKRKLAGRIIGKVLLNKEIALFLTYGSSVASLLNISSGKLVNQIQLANNLYFVSKPLFVSNKIILPTQVGIFAFSSRCQ